MLNIPDEVKTRFKADNISSATARKLRLRFYDEDVQLLFPEDTLFPSDDLFPIDQEPVYVIENPQIYTESMTITEGLCESLQLTFGECNASQFEITVADALIDLTGKEFMATVEIGDYEMSMGIYRVDSFIRQADRRMKKIVAYDRMKKFHVDAAEWYRGLTFPMTLKQFRDSLCSYVGTAQLSTELPLDNMQLTQTIQPEKLFALDILKKICEINGCFGHFDKTGRLRYTFLPKSGLFPAEDLLPSDDLFPADLSESSDTEILSFYKRSDTKYEDYVVHAIEKVQIRQEENDVGAIYGHGTNMYIIQGNWLVYGKSADELMLIAGTVHGQISAISYRPSKIVTAALPWVEVGDGLVCYTVDDVIETYCTKRTMKGIQAMLDTYESSGSQEVKENTSISSEIIQLEGKSAAIKRSVEEVSVRVTDLQTYTEAQVQILSDSILAEVTRATEAEAALKIMADEISLSVTNLRNFTEAQINILSNEISLKVSTGDVVNQVNSELLIKDKYIKFTTGSLLVDAKNFQLDINGNATFSGNIVGGSINIGRGTFVVDDDGEVQINTGEIKIGGVSITENFVDLGAFRVTTDKYGLIYSEGDEIEIFSSAYYPEGNPGITIKKNRLQTRVGFGGIATYDVELEQLVDEYGSLWGSVAKNIIELWDRVESIESSL